MKFHLNHIPEKPGFEIDHSHKLFLTGSCFSENIGHILQEHKFNVTTNTGGILFNPLSICTHLSDVISGKEFDEKYILQRDGLFLSYLHHSSVHSKTKEDLIEHIHTAHQKAGLFLKDTDCLVITFGSAFYYQHKSLDTAVANCHKQPGPIFEKRLLSTAEIFTVYSDLIEKLRTVNPDLKIIFTVSPVKHLKDGVQENSISKATLLLSIHQLVKQYEQCFYFPAYELVNDDLRDYRFYKADMAHPNELAIDYVWQKFSGCFFNDKTLDLNKRIQKLSLALAHRSMHGNSEESEKLQQFISKQKEEIKKLNPGIEL